MLCRLSVDHCTRAAVLLLYAYAGAAIALCCWVGPYSDAHMVLLVPNRGPKTAGVWVQWLSDSRLAEFQKQKLKSIV